MKEAPRGRGPYGICTTPAGDVWWCSLAGSFIARIDRRTGESTVVEPPTPRPGRAPHLERQPRPHLGQRMEQRQPVDARPGRRNSWRTWKLPGAIPQRLCGLRRRARQVWVSEFGGNAVFRFDPRDRAVRALRASRATAPTCARSSAGRGEVWLPESGTEHISVIRTA